MVGLLPGTEAPYAQTIIQLFNQLRDEGYSNTELSLVREAYELAMHFFTGCFTASGRTLIAHVAGTASILGSLHVPAEVAAAGLIHNVYGRGDFGDGRRGISHARRQQISQAVGARVEQYVYRFPTLRFNPQTISAVCSTPETLEPIDRYVFLIHLAERIDHRLNLEYVKQNDHLIGQLAAKLGFPTLAAELKRVFGEAALAEFSVELVSKGFRHSRVIAPRSYRKRLWPALRPKLSHSFYRLRSNSRVRTKFRRLWRNS